MTAPGFRRHLWQRQIVPMLNSIRYDCAPLTKSAAPWWEDGAHALPFTYEELTQRSEIRPSGSDPGLPGLDFTTDGEASVRGILYRKRQDVQSEFGLYFDDYRGGLRFTMLPKLGMLWRYEEEQRRTANALARTAEMTHEAIRATGTQIEAQLFKAVAKQYKEVEEGAGRLRQMTQVLFARPQALKVLPPRRRRRKRP